MKSLLYLLFLIVNALHLPASLAGPGGDPHRPNTTGDTMSNLTLTTFAGDDDELRWVRVNDTVMGGRSSSAFVVKAGILHFTGYLNTNGGGFASVRSAPETLGMDQHQHIRLRVRGDGRTYQLRLMTDNRGASYRASFPTVAGQWQEITLPIDRFQATWRGRLLDRPPPAPTDIRSLGLMIADQQDGPFALEVDWIEALLDS